MHFLRTSRHASAIITAVVLVVIGVVVGLTRHDGGDQGGVVLRADEQALQPVPTITVPGDIVERTPTANGGAGEPPPMSLGNLNAPINPPSGGKKSTGGGGGGDDGSTDTTQRSSGGTTSTTLASSSDAFGPGRIAYTASATVWTVNPDGSGRARVAAPAYAPAWSPDHTAIAYADADAPGGVLRVASDGDNYALTTGVAKDSQPAWSPDGKQIAFGRIDNTQTVEYSEIWIVNRDGSNTRQITHLPCFNRDPSWSPDGKKLVFWSSSDHCVPGPGQGNYELYVVDVATAKVTRLNTAANSGSPAWSPDGKSIAFASDGYGGVGFEICVMNADGSNAHRVTNLSGDDTDPAWSPDGKTLAFTRGSSIYTMRSDGSAAQVLAAGGAQPAWY